MFVHADEQRPPNDRVRTIMKHRTQFIVIVILGGKFYFKSGSELENGRVGR